MQARKREREKKIQEAGKKEANQGRNKGAQDIRMSINPYHPSNVKSFSFSFLSPSKTPLS
jgi:hypothetical protein